MLRSLSAIIGARNSQSRLLVTSSFWSVILRVAGMAVTFLLGVLLARYLGPAGFGIYGVAMGIVALLSAAAQLGLPTLATREISVSRVAGDWPALRGVIRWFPILVGATAALLGACFLAVVFLVPGASAEFRAVTLWSALTVPAMALIVLVSAELRAFDRLVAGQSLEIFVRPAVVAALLLLLFHLNGAISPAGAMAMNFAGSVMALVLAGWWLAREVPPEARRQTPVAEPKRWAKAGAPLAVTEILRQLDGTYAVLVMGAFTTAAQTGVFRVAHSSLGVVALPLSVLQVVLAPTLARLHAEGDREKLQTVLAVAASLMFGGALAIILFLAVAGHWLITTVFGAEYAGAWLPLILLTAAQAILGFFGLAPVMLAMGGREKELLRSYATAMVVSISAAIPLSIWWGGVGVALAAMIGATVNAGLAWHFVRSRMGLDASLLGAVSLVGSPRRAASPDGEAPPR